MSTLYEKLYSIDHLFASWKHIKSKGSAGGVDGLSVVQFEENLHSHLLNLQKELKEGSWKPNPYLRVEIKKNEQEKRKLGLLSIKDKIVQQAIRYLIEPRFEHLFLGNSYGYRPGKGHTKAIRRTLNEVQCRKNKFIVQLDIDNYFDSIHHDILFARLRSFLKENEIIRLIELSVKMGVVSKRLKWSECLEGLPQGAVLSPLLSNFYLHPFDQFVTSKTKAYVRYADDFLFLTETEEQTKELVERTTIFLNERLRLRLNEPIIRTTEEGIEFLGVTIRQTGISISDSKRMRLKDRIVAIGMEKGKITSKSLEGLDGIKRYYAPLLSQDELQFFDEEVSTRISDLLMNYSGPAISKKELSNELMKIPSFSTQALLRHKEQMKEWLDLYVAPKRLEIEHGADANRKIINSKKREYQKMEAEGSELVVSSYGSFIGKSARGITVKIGGKNVRNHPSNALKHITVLTKAVTISGEAIAYCMKHKIKIDFFDFTDKHYASILSPALVEETLWQKQVAISIEQKIHLATSIIVGKIRNQINLIKYFHKYHRGCTILTQKKEEAVASMSLLLDKVKAIDCMNEEYAKLLIAV